MGELITILFKLGFTPLNIILMVMIYLLMANMGIVPKWWNGKNKKVDHHQMQINYLQEHAKVANEEMGEIQKSISGIEKDVSFIKGKLDK